MLFVVCSALVLLLFGANFHSLRAALLGSLTSRINGPRSLNRTAKRNGKRESRDKWEQKRPRHRAQALTRAERSAQQRPAAAEESRCRRSARECRIRRALRAYGSVRSCAGNTAGLCAALIMPLNRFDLSPLASRCRLCVDTSPASAEGCAAHFSYRPIPAIVRASIRQ